MSSITVKPLSFPEASGVMFGVTVADADIEHPTVWENTRQIGNLLDNDFDVIRNALFTRQLVVFKNQGHLTPKAQYELTRRFDPGAVSCGHGKSLDSARSILHPDLKTIPHQPQVQVIGNGRVAEYEGLRDIQLRHPHHRTFHATQVSPEEDHDFTRFYRWHIDAALYGLAPPIVTTLLAVRVPGGRRQVCRYDDGSDDQIEVPLGTTAFFSGESMYDSLSEADKHFARTTRLRSDGLGLESQGLELPFNNLPPVEQDKIQILPMCWRNPVTGNLALQIHPSAVHKLHLVDGTIVDDLPKVREIVHDLQRPGIAPRMVYAHDWEEGDLVLFHNRGLLHSVVGAFAEDEVRLFRQCNVAATEFPLGPV